MIQAKTIHYATERGERWKQEKAGSKWVNMEVATRRSDGLRLESPRKSGETRKEE